MAYARGTGRRIAARLGGMVAAAWLAACISMATGAPSPSEVLREEDGTELRLAYYPSSNRLRLLVLTPPPEYERWELKLTRAEQPGVLVQKEGRLPFESCGETLELPAADEAAASETDHYVLELALLARDGKRRPLRRSFDRRRFAWENNSLGRDRVVIPPFTPLVVHESSSAVDCVLRRHELDGNGLWRQITSQNCPMLASSMRLEIESGGKCHVAAGGSVQFGEKSADRVRGKSEWTAGPFQGSTQFEFEYDGLARFELRLAPAALQVDAMQLVIPMRTSETWLMHPVTDLLRHHYAGRIPDGRGKLWDYSGKLRDVNYTASGRPDADGKVWDSRHVARWQLPAPFVPYIWLGGPERGICWFAENDRDWSLDPERPMLEIRRKGETTSLVVRFITRPCELNRSRVIAFGLMATPAKPMLDSPVSFRRWFAGSMGAQTTQTSHFSFMGSCYYWGAAGPCFAFYPAFGDFTVYDELARVRRSGTIDPGFVNRWLERFRDDQFASQRETYRTHINWSLNLFADAGWRNATSADKAVYAIPYTNARAISWGDEVRTFADEWSTIDVADPRWPGEERFLRAPGGDWTLNSYGKLESPNESSGIAYAVDPVSSWQDLVLYYHRRMLDTFADGIYFDDYFLAPNYCPFGPGYVDDKGNLRPGVNILGFRELAKRIAVLHHQTGRRPLLFIHMTNANIVPMLSFSTLLLDHEWRDQGEFADQDFHERLHLDEDTSLLLAQSTGLQSGSMGVIHDLLHGPQRDRLLRSGVGVALTHEMKFPLYWEPLGRAIAEHLAHFGYGLPDCRVFRYWDEPPAVRTEGAAAKTLVLARGGAALVVAASYGPAGDVTLELDTQRLGLTGELSAVDLESGAAVTRSGPARFTMSLPRHDFRLIRVAPPDR